MNELTGKSIIKEIDKKEAQGSCLLEIHTLVEHMSKIHYVYKKDVKGMKRSGNQPQGSNG